MNDRVFVAVLQGIKNLLSKVNNLVLGHILLVLLKVWEGIHVHELGNKVDLTPFDIDLEQLQDVGVVELHLNISLIEQLFQVLLCNVRCLDNFDSDIETIGFSFGLVDLRVGSISDWLS